jgi:hypothetical protein
MANGWDQFPQVEASAPAASGWDSFPVEQQTASLIPETGRVGDFAAPQMQGVQMPDAPPQQPKRQAELRAYEPTWREKAAQFLMGDSRASPERERLVRGVMGTTGLPGSEQIGAVDFTPARIPLFAQEAKRAYDEGNYGTAALNAVGATPIPLVDKAVGGAVKGLRRLGTTGDEGARSLVQGADNVAEDAVKQAPRRMSPKELKAAATAAYKEADEAGVIFTPRGVQRIADEVKVELAEFGYHPGLHPQVKIALDELDRIATGNVTFKGMDTLRKMTKAAANSLKDEERKAGMMIIDKIDDLMDSSKTFETLAGQTEQASEAIRRARDLWGRSRRTDLIETIVRNAELRAASTGSGGNVNNAIRQDLRKLITNERHARKFSKKELAQIEKVVRGTAPLNTLRLIGKLSPEGGALGLVGGIGMSAGAFTVNPALAAIPIGGAIAKRAADYGTNRAVNKLLTDVSSGSKRNALAR